VAQTLFSSLVQDYVRAHGWGLDRPEGRMVALIDAELDEGNIFECLLEGWNRACGTAGGSSTTTGRVSMQSFARGFGSVPISMVTMALTRTRSLPLRKPSRRAHRYATSGQFDCLLSLPAASA
jgi:hypothetical protein